MNDGAFHLVLANKIGIEAKSFIGDIEAGAQVWNHAVYDYFSHVQYSNNRPYSNSAPGTVKIVRVRTDLLFVGESKSNSWEPMIGTPWQKFDRRVYVYDLDIDAQGNIIGGVAIKGPSGFPLDRGSN